MNKDKQIEEMAKYCTYHHNGECFAVSNHPTDCDLMCEMFGLFANLEMAGYRKQSAGCDFCKTGSEKCGTCVMFFDYHEDGGSDRCYTEYGADKCAYYKPVHFCSNCGAKINAERRSNDER